MIILIDFILAIVAFVLSATPDDVRYFVASFVENDTLALIDTLLDGIGWTLHEDVSIEKLP